MLKWATHAAPFTAKKEHRNAQREILRCVGSANGWQRLSLLRHVSGSLPRALSVSACLEAKHSWGIKVYFPSLLIFCYWCVFISSPDEMHFSSSTSTPPTESRGSIQLFWSWLFGCKVVKGDQLDCHVNLMFICHSRSALWSSCFQMLHSPLCHFFGSPSKLENCLLVSAILSFYLAKKSHSFSQVFSVLFCFVFAQTFG